MDIRDIILFFISIIVIGALAYHGYDGIRAGLTGTQTRGSKEVEDPTKPSNRFGALLWGLTALFILFGGFAFFLRLVG